MKHAFSNVTEGERITLVSSVNMESYTITVSSVTTEGELVILRTFTGATFLSEDPWEVLPTPVLKAA